MEEDIFKRFEISLLDASRKAFTSLFEKYKEKFYYCTLISYDGYCPCIYAWSEEALDKFIKENEIPEDEFMEYKWSDAESPYSGYGYDEYFGETARIFENIWEKADYNDKNNQYARWLDNGLFLTMENVMRTLKEEGIFGDKDACRNIMFNALISPPDSSNTQRALRLNNKEDIEEWLREMSEECLIEKIARIISDNDADVMNDIDICVNNTDTYFNEHAVDYDERGITKEIIEEEEIEEDEIRWLGMIDILEKYGYVCEVDTSEYLEDFIDVVQDFNGTKNNNLPINADWFDEDADTFEWCEVLDGNWTSEGYCIANIEFDGDDLVLFPCPLELLEELNGFAEEAGYSIKHAKDA